MPNESGMDGGLHTYDKLAEQKKYLKEIEERLARVRGEASLRNPDGTLSFIVGRENFWRKKEEASNDTADRDDTISQLEQARLDILEEIRILKEKE